jgi:hypothetical protein
VVSWIVRGLLVISGTVTEWFVSKDATNFTLSSFSNAQTCGIGDGVIVAAQVLRPFATRTLDLRNPNRWLQRTGHLLGIRS